MRPIPDRAVSFVAQREGCELRAYADPASGGAPYTIGYGHTGPEVRLGLKITQEQATNFLRADLATARARIFKRIGAVMDELSEAQFCVLLSFTFNLGDGDPKKKEWTIWKLLRAREFDQVPGQLVLFIKAAGKVNKGLVNRRNAEVALWHEGETVEALPSSVTRSIPTPPVPTDTKPLTQSKSFMTGAISAAAAATTAVGEVSKTVSPYAATNELVGKIVSTLALIAAGLAVATLVFVWLKKKAA